MKQIVNRQNNKPIDLFYVNKGVKFWLFFKFGLCKYRNVENGWLRLFRYLPTGKSLMTICRTIPLSSMMKSPLPECPESSRKTPKSLLILWLESLNRGMATWPPKPPSLLGVFNLKMLNETFEFKLTKPKNLHKLIQPNLLGKINQMLWMVLLI